MESMHRKRILEPVFIPVLDYDNVIKMLPGH